ncbi:hypothetical protein ANCCEY_15693, partial [Ancylostoma ceylanicum]
LGWKMRRTLLWCALFAYAAADIYSCGGFVKSNVPIDYSKIQFFKGLNSQSLHFEAYSHEFAQNI